MSSARFIVGDVFEVLATLPENSVDLVLTSPPFLALRSYLPADHPDKAKEIGQESGPAEFIDTLLDVVEACDRVLAPAGSIVFELGDTYAGSGGAGGDYNAEGLRDGQQKFRQARNRRGWPLDKSLCGIPTLFSWSLAYGRNLLRPERTTEPWRIRNVIAWCRSNPPVGSLGDKFRPATSYLTVACKSRDRWFDLDAVRRLNHPERMDEKAAHSPKDRLADPRALSSARGSGEWNPLGAPPLDWWEVATRPYPGSHYATWPRELLVDPVKAMCPPGGVVLDPFAGSGTTLEVATGHGRDAIGIDLDERNAELARARVGMFLTVEHHEGAAA